MSERPLAVITGASGGIGLELARCAAADGFDLVLVARRRDVLDAVAGEIQSRYRVSAAVIDADLGEPGAAARLLAQIERPIEVLLNNAGFGIWESFAESDAAELDAMVAMVGLVLADDLLLLFVFWELTTVASFLLIGFEHDKESARDSARRC